MITDLIALNFVIHALLAGIGIALVAGPLGSIIIWRRMSYLGDALSHSTLLGVSLALILNINLYLGLCLVCILIAFSFIFIENNKKISSDTALVILSNSILACGLIAVTSVKGVRIDLLAYIYGDILSVTRQDLIWIAIIDCLVLTGIYLFWKKILAITIHEELAQVEGVQVFKVKIILIMLMALVFAVAMKLIGALMITALMVIPAATARQISSTPLQMAMLAIFFGFIAVVGGIFLSTVLDWPAGPAIVVVAASCFVLLSVITKQQ